MTKVRVHELAKELNIQSKELLTYLGKGYTVQSGLDDAEVALVKAKYEEAQRSKALEKKAVLLKAPKKEPLKAPSESQAAPAEAPKPKTQEPVKPAPGDETKKKKPLFIFRPENAKSSIGDRFPKKPSESPKRNEEAKAPQGRIKPNVPTTAEQYRDYQKPEPKAEEKKTEEKSETIVTPETKPEVTETVVKPVETKPEKKDTAPEPEKQEKKETVPETKAEVPEQAKVKAPTAEKKETTVSPAKETPKNEEKADVKPAEPAQPKKPGLNIVGRVDLSRVKEAEERKSDGDRKSVFGKTNGKMHFVDNRNGKPGDRTQKGTRPQPYGKDGDSRNQSSAQKSNRGIFAKNGAKAGTSVHVNTAAGDKLSAKPDTRGKKGVYKNDKDRGSFDKNGKKAENFKNLTKDVQGRKKQEEKEEVIKMIVLPETITIQELADKMKLKASELIKKLFLQGKMTTVNSELTYEEAESIALDYDILCEKEEQVDVIEELLKEEEEDESKMVKRPPVVCVMGHVDHGKTSLLDAIRSTNVTSREAGGITQHIGAYMVECKGEKITFLDTPGHEAFTAMRMRGAMATDIAILVVAADDGVMPQTVEAINHAKAAGVDVIVAVNKIDKPAANVDKVKQELMEYGLVSEEWGGSTIFVPVSAKTRQNIDTLLEMILLVTEVKELKANPNRALRGIVIEAKLDKGRGPVATVLVQKGTLKPGDFVSAGSCYGRVRAMLDADGNPMKSALPSTPVEILGLNGVPNAGEICIGHKNEKDARSYAETFIAEEKKRMLAETKHKLTMDTLFDQIQAGNIKELPIVLKADVQGSVEALKTSLEKLSNDEVAVKVIHSGVGLINESDVTLASASNAIVIGFNVRPDAQAKLIADQESVDLKLYKVIYQVIDDVEAAMKGMLAPVYEEKVLGHAEIRVIFKASGIGSIAGSYVLDGTLERGCKARITRDKDVIFDGNIASLKRFKDDVKEVREGYECGIVFEKFNDIQEGDLVEGYKMVQVERQ